MSMKFYMFAVSLFVVSSLFHAFKNSFFTKKNPLRKKLLYAHYFCLLLLITATLALVLTQEIQFTHQLIADLVLVLAITILIQTLRFGFDYWDLSPRNRKSDIVRHIADAAANFITIALILMTITMQIPYLTMISIFFCIMIFGKELKYRIRDDFFQRDTLYAISTSHGGVGRASPRLKRHAHAFIRLFKSAAYINLSFGLFLLCYSQFNTSLKALIADNLGALSPLLSAMSLAYSLLGKPEIKLDWIIIIFQYIPYGVSIFFGFLILSAPQHERR